MGKIEKEDRPKVSKAQIAETEAYLQSCMRLGMTIATLVADADSIDLEAITGMNRQSFQRALSGRTKISGKVFAAFCRALDLDPTEVIVNGRELYGRDCTAPANAVSMLKGQLRGLPEAQVEAVLERLGVREPRQGESHGNGADSGS